MSDSLKAKTLHGLLWGTVDWCAVYGAQFVIGIILSRILGPEPGGMIGLLAIFMAMARSILDSGFGSALIQRQETTETDNCSIFYFNIVVGCVIASLLCLAAPWIAAFYQEPLLTPLTRALSLSIVINSFGLIQLTLMVKRVDFKTQAKINTISNLLSGVVGVVMAMRGFGVWSLVVQAVGASIFRTMLLWYFNTWRPSLLFSFAALRRLFGFGSRMLATGLLGTFFDNIYVVVIGRLFSVTDVGYFNRARAFAELPSSSISGVVYRVTFPIFSMMQKDRARMKRALQKAILVLVFVNFPIMIGLMASAKATVLILLGQEWVPCIPYLRLWCASSILYPLQLINVNVLTSTGRSDLLFRLELIKRTLIVIAIAVSIPWGVEGLIIGKVVVSYLSYYLNSYYTASLVNYPMTEQIWDLLPCLSVAGLMGAAAYSMEWLPWPNLWLLLLSQVGAGVSIYFILSYLFRFSALHSILETFRANVLAKAA